MLFVFLYADLYFTLAFFLSLSLVLHVFPLSLSKIIGDDIEF